MKKDVVINRYIPFIFDVVRKEQSETLEKYIMDNFDLKYSSQTLINMDLLKKQLRKEGIDHRTFPILVKGTKPISGTRIIRGKTDEDDIRINYLATIVFGLISASREIFSKDNLQQVSEYISGIAQYIRSIIQMEREMEEDLLALSGMIESAHTVLREIAPNSYKKFQNRLETVEIEDDGQLIEFKLLADTDIRMEQSIYIYDSKIGFLVNQISIENFDTIDQDTIYSMDLLFRLCSGGLKYQEESDLLEEIDKSLSSLNISGLSMSDPDEYSDVINYREEIKTKGLEMESLLDNPLVELYDTKLRGNLFLLMVKNATSLKSQADFRTALKNNGAFRKKVDITTSMGFIFLQMFHEEFQTRRYLDIYSESWENWYNKLAEALNYSTVQILFGKTRFLDDIYHHANRLELFFVRQFNDMSISSKIDELAETVRFHLYIINVSETGITILPRDMVDQPGEGVTTPTTNVMLDKLEVLNDESSYIEFIDPKLFFKVMANRLNLANNYRSFRELHQNLEEMLNSVQEIAQTKQQRVITIAIVIFSITELVLAFLEVFGALFGVS